MYSCGGNTAGQLGLGSISTSITSFTQVSQISSQAWTNVWNFGQLTFATATGGNLYSCG